MDFGIIIKKLLIWKESYCSVDQIINELLLLLSGTNDRERIILFSLLGQTKHALFDGIWNHITSRETNLEHLYLLILYTGKSILLFAK